MVIATKRKGSLERLTGDKYFNLIEHAADGIAILQDGVFKLVNTALTRISGYDKEELLGMPFTQLLTPESQKLTLARYQARLAGKKVPPVYEIKAVIKDGEVRDIEVNAALTEYEGRIADEVIIRDITERKQAEEALKESQKFSSSLLENSPNPMSVINPDTSVRYVNPAFEKLTGFTLAEITDRKAPYPWWPERKMREITASLKDAMVTGGRRTERTFQKKNGERFWAAVNSAPVVHEGKLIYFILNWLDITERKQMEEALADEATRRRILVEQSRDGIVVLEQNGKVYETNQRFAEMLGYSSEEVRQLSVFDWEYLYPREQVLEMIRTVDEAGDHFETQHRRKDGSTYDVEISTNAATFAGQKLIFCVCRDITERKQAEEALRRAEEEKTAILDSMSEVVVFQDMEHQLIWANKVASESVDLSPEQLVGRHCYEIWHKRSKPCVGCPVAKAREMGQPQASEMTTPDGRVWFVQGYPVRDANNDIAGFVESALDITERKKTEQLQHDENYVLTILGQGAELSGLLDAIVRLGEYNDPSIKGSVLLFDPSKSKELLFQASAPSLPDDYKELLENGVPIGPNAGSCGTAAYLQERVIVTDIANSPLFKPFEEVIKRAVNNSLLAVWSQPIIASNGDLLGTIANYSNKVGEPSADNLRVLEWSARIAAIAIERKQAEEALRESEEKFSKAFRSSPDTIAITRLRDGLFLEVNDNFTCITGYTREEVINHTSTEINIWAKAEDRTRMVQILKEKGKVQNEEFEFRMKSGEIRVWLFSGEQIDIGGEPCIISMTIDITERKQMEQQLQKKNEQGEPCIISMTIDITERKQMEQQLQEKNEQLDAQNEELKAINEELQATEQQLQENNEQLDAQNEELRAVNEELRATEEELQRSQEKLERMFESVTDGIVVANLDGTILKVNQKAVQIHGFASEDELLGKNAFELVAPQDHERITNNMRKVLKEGLIRGQEYTLLRADGSEFPGELSTSALKDASGNVIGRITIARDITKRKQAEQRERQLQQELDLTSRLASIGQMASGVAHEINNPLTGVIGFSHLLMSRDIPDDMKQDLQVINSEAQRVAKIVENLLTFARQRKPGREYVDINDIIARVLELRSYEMKVDNIEVETQLAPDLPSAMADAGQLQQVFLNIVLNAEYFMTTAHNMGKLLVKTERTGDNIRVSFTDDGAGISKENLDKIFNPFFTTKEVGNGTGLGLSICHGIITQHKGTIYAQSELDQGATFVVELPIADEPTQAEQAKVTKEKPQKPRGAKILVVDDEPAILTLLRRLLTQWGHSVETINNADAALNRLQRERYSLILLDIKLPGMSGVELYHHIEEIAPALTRRIMFITGDIMEASTQDFLDRAKVPHITKPIDIELLKNTLNHALNKTQVAATTPG